MNKSTYMYKLEMNYMTFNGRYINKYVHYSVSTFNPCIVEITPKIITSASQCIFTNICIL